ncbi:MAG: hypothetical protein K2Y27_35135 [Xanthobacteraceae bacterium]|nr:hypothetical protein [Xanthobacteraceae bacterium]
MAVKIGLAEINDQLLVRLDDGVHFVRCRSYRAIGFIGLRLEGSIESADGSIQLLANSLYFINGIPDRSADRISAYVSTEAGVPRLMSKEEFQASRELKFPEEAARVRAEKETAARRFEQLTRIRQRGSVSARRERNILAAEDISAGGQPPSELPPLTGTPKQIAYAIEIRNEFALRHPGDPVQKKATRAKYWIENHKQVLTRPED